MNKITHVTQPCIDLIIASEGLLLKPYFCPSHVPTIGIGTTRYPNGDRVTINDRPITKDQALSFLDHDLKVFELAVDAMATDLLTQNQFNGLVCFAYNLGSNALKGSTLLRKVNVNPNDITIKDEFKKWVHGEGGAVLPGLVTRREKESEMYFSK